jgi:GABA permease
MREILVVANQSLGSDDLAVIVTERIAKEETHFHLLVPATRPPRDVAAKFESTFTEDADEAAQRQLDVGLSWLRRLGATVDGDVGDADPVRGVGDTLKEKTYDEVIISTLPSGLSRWLHQDLPHRVERKYKLPVTVVTAKSVPARRVPPG